jgi:hypothetical protein
MRTPPSHTVPASTCTCHASCTPPQPRPLRVRAGEGPQLPASPGGTKTHTQEDSHPSLAPGRPCRAQVKDPSFLRFLVDMRDADLDDRQLRDDLMTMLVAGHETTAAVLTWALFSLAQQPEVEAKVLAEIDSVVGDRQPGEWRGFVGRWVGQAGVQGWDACLGVLVGAGHQVGSRVHGKVVGGPLVDAGPGAVFVQRELCLGCLKEAGGGTASWSWCFGLGEGGRANDLQSGRRLVGLGCKHLKCQISVLVEQSLKLGSQLDVGRNAVPLCVYAALGHIAHISLQLPCGSAFPMSMATDSLKGAAVSGRYLLPFLSRRSAGHLQHALRAYGAG